MLSNLRNNIAHNKVIRSFLIVLTVGFIVWGMGLSNFTNSKLYTVKVGDVEISASEYNYMYQQQLQQITRQFGGQAPSKEILSLIGFKNKVNEQAISSALIENYAQELNLYIHEKTIYNLLKQSPEFNNEGKFDKQAYLTTLRSAQINPQEYEENIAKQLKATFIVSAFNNVSNITDAELEAEADYAQERRNVDILTIKSTDIKPAAEPTQAELDELYEENKENYVISEKRDYDSLKISNEQFAKTINITNEQAATYYENNKDDFYTKPEYKISQILLEDKDQADMVLALADLNSNFTNYVEQYSTDSVSKAKKGDMGWLTSDIFGPQFETIVNTLAKGDTATTAFESAFGFHIFKLVDLKDSKLETLAQVNDKIKAELKTQESEDLLDEKINLILDLSSEGETLANIANQLGLQVTPFKNEALEELSSVYTQKAFKLEEGEVSEQIDIDANTIAFVQTTSIMPESFQSAQELNSKLTMMFKRKKTDEALTLKAEEIHADLYKNNISFTQAAIKYDLSSPIKSVVALKRSGNDKKGINDSIATDIFNFSKGKLIDHHMRDADDKIIVSINTVYIDSITDEEKAKLKTQLESTKINEMYSLFISSLKMKNDVKVNDAIIKQIIK